MDFVNFCNLFFLFEGDRQEVRTEHGKLPFSKLLTYCKALIPNVVSHFTNFLKHPLRNYIIMDAQKFVAAKFIATIREDHNVDNLLVNDTGKNRFMHKMYVLKRITLQYAYNYNAKYFFRHFRYSQS